MDHANLKIWDTVENLSEHYICSSLSAQMMPKVDGSNISLSAMFQSTWDVIDNEVFLTSTHADVISELRFMQNILLRPCSL